MLQSNGVKNVMDLVSNKLGIDTSAECQEVQYKANSIEDSVLNVDNLQNMWFIYAGGIYSQVNMDDVLKNSKEDISFFILQRNTNAPLLNKRITKSNIQ